MEQPQYSVAPITFTNKPQPGTAGKYTKVLVNYYRCAVENGERHQIDVSFSEKLPKTLARSIFAKEFPEHIYDGDKIGFSMFPIEETTKVHRREEKNEKPEDITIVIKPSNVVDTGLDRDVRTVAMEAHQFLKVLIRQFPSHSMLEIGRNKYFDHNVGAQSSGGVEMRSGFFQSFINTQLGPVMNIDIATCAFWKGIGLVALIAELTNTRDLSDFRPSPNAFSRLRGLTNVRIRVKHGPRERTYSINRLSREGADGVKFEYQGNEVTVAKYFEMVYGKRLTFPHLPCVIVNAKGKPGAQFPVELCSVDAGQVYKPKLDPQQTSDMIRFAAKKPFDRANIINGGLAKLGYPINSFMEQFKVSMQPKMLSLTCRILPPPRMLYGGQQMMQPRDGTWNMKGVRVTQPCTITSWGVLVTSGQRDRDRTIDFMRAMLREGSNLGINLPEQRPPIHYMERGVTEEVRKLYETCEATYQVRPELLLVVYLDNDHGSMYNQIKYLSECKIGFMTQFLNASKLSKASAPQYAANMWLKINAKLGGVNAIVSPNDITIASSAPTMIFGLDVSHPSPGDKTSPSICAVTASLDRNIGRFACVTSYQGNRVEIITQLKDSVKKLISLFGQKNNVLPCRLIFFRDGVGEGQFARVNVVEISAVKQAIAEMYKDNPAPQLLFSIIVKGHHARFFPESQQDADRSGNMKAGMVVDTEITSPYLYDFFLQSHAGLQGTNRAMHYYVLYDEIGMDADALQTFINATCYTFCRCTRSVKMVPSVYYAHLAADRARKWISGGSAMGIRGFPSDSGSITSGQSGGAPSNACSDFSWCPEPVGMVASGMYFA